jgi:transcriptional regulator with XRE-family HTH domain
MATKLGEYFKLKSVNKADIARKSKLSSPRLTELSNNSSAKLRADELYLIALAMNVSPCELLEFVCGDLNPRGN